MKNELSLGNKSMFSYKLQKEIKNALDEIISSKQKITCWYKLNDDGTTEYNHYENSWVTVDKPNILFKDSVEQKQWKNINWKKKFQGLN